MIKEDNHIDVPLKISFDSPKYIDVKLPEWFLEDLELMSRISAMRMRAFLFFKRPLSPSEKKEMYYALTRAPPIVKEE